MKGFFGGFLRQRILWFVIALYLWAWSAAPQKALVALQAGMTLLLSVTLLIVAVFALVGLIQTWIGREMIARVLGREGGIKGLLLAVGCGALLIGPPYVIFPLLMSLRRLGARWAVVAIVLAAYALKPQMMPIETQFLGLPFTLVRSGLTLLLAIPLGLVVEWFMPEDENL
ncbi:MAG: permease [Geopsychrobacter sp.]|nr:permease [Geopsychrobacter sp.]